MKLFGLLVVLMATPTTSLAPLSSRNPLLVVKRFGLSNNVLVCRMTEEEKENNNDLFGGIKNFFKELDNFVEDATSRRLGNGSSFYGKRKSNFYGEGDTNKKQIDGFDLQEDYRGPDSSGYFIWTKDEETGQMIPTTRMKNKNLEKRMPSELEGDDVNTQ